MLWAVDPPGRTFGYIEKMFLLAICNNILKQFFIILPYSIQTILCRGNPDLAFFIRKRKKNVTIDYYLNEFTLELDLNLDQERRMLSGTYEPEIKAILPRLVGKNDICLDIGANVGAISFALAKLVGKEGIVHAFESTTLQAKKLKRNLQMNSALKDRILLHEKLFTKNSFEEISALNIRVDFIRMDLNALELDVLDGAMKILQKYRPNILFEISISNEEQKKSAQELEKKLRSLGYQVLRISRDFDLLPTTYPNFSESLVAMTRSRIDSLHYV